MQVQETSKSVSPLTICNEQDGVKSNILPSLSADSTLLDRRQEASNITSDGPCDCPNQATSGVKTEQIKRDCDSSSSEHSLSKDMGSQETGHLHAPKRPLSPFIFFSQEERKKIKKQSPNLITKNIIKQVEKNWRSMTPEQKQPYEKMSIRNREDYKLKVKAFDQAKLASQANPEKSIIDRIKSRRELKIAKKKALKERRVTENQQTRKNKKAERRCSDQIRLIQNLSFPVRPEADQVSKQMGQFSEAKGSVKFLKSQEPISVGDHSSCVDSDEGRSGGQSRCNQESRLELQREQNTRPASKIENPSLDFKHFQIHSPAERESLTYQQFKDPLDELLTNFDAQPGKCLDNLQTSQVKDNKIDTTSSAFPSHDKKLSKFNSTELSKTRLLNKKVRIPHKRQKTYNQSADLNSNEVVNPEVVSHRGSQYFQQDQDARQVLPSNLDDKSKVDQEEDVKVLPSFSDFIRATNSLPKPLFQNDQEQQKQTEQQELVNNLNLFCRNDQSGEYPKEEWNEDKFRECPPEQYRSSNHLRSNFFVAEPNEWQATPLLQTPVQQNFFNNVEPGSFCNYRQQPQINNLSSENQFQQPVDLQINKQIGCPKINFNCLGNDDPFVKYTKMANELQFDLAAQSNSSSSAYPPTPQSNVTSSFPPTPQSQNGPNTYDSFPVPQACQSQTCDLDDDPNRFFKQENEIGDDASSVSSIEDICQQNNYFNPQPNQQEGDSRGQNEGYSHFSSFE